MFCMKTCVIHHTSWVMVHQSPVTCAIQPLELSKRCTIPLMMHLLTNACCSLVVYAAEPIQGMATMWRTKCTRCWHLPIPILSGQRFKLRMHQWHQQGGPTERLAVYVWANNSANISGFGKIGWECAKIMSLLYQVPCCMTWHLHCQSWPQGWPMRGKIPKLHKMLKLPMVNLGQSGPTHKPLLHKKRALEMPTAADNKISKHG
mmetsp:Transcript_6498/g.11648  ORF Transcript_6498/g.11648 Transcript_6498/m.11648 type:complete len:204 (+) Transcript_6498:859-1470(+)